MNYLKNILRLKHLVLCIKFCAKQMIKKKKKKSELVNIFNSGLEDLKEEIKKMSKEEIEIEKPDEIVRVAEMILDFNKQNQQGKGLKILTPNQMLSRLPLTLAQLKAENNSEKL